MGGLVVLVGPFQLVAQACLVEMLLALFSRTWSQGDWLQNPRGILTSWQSGSQSLGLLPTPWQLKPFHAIST